MDIHASEFSWWDMSPHEVRDKINQRIMSIDAPIPTVFSVIDRSITRDDRNTSIRIYTHSEGNNFPIILLIHGGAWVAGSLDTHDNLARFLASQVKAIVISVGYINAPEGKFPLQLEQCYDTLMWIVENGSELCGDITRIAIVGDSAGGNMAAALCLMNRDRSVPKIVGQILINPAPDLTCNGTLLRQNDSLDLLRWQALQYLSDPKEVINPYVSPLIASDLRNLPPAVVILAEEDDLREAGQKYADRLQAAGIPTYVYCQQGVNHLAGHAARASSYARESLDVVVKHLQKMFSKQKHNQNPSIAHAANHYVRILSKIGNAKGNSEEITSLCANNCKKVRNGKQLFQGKEFFASQLNSGKEWLGSWSIDVQEILISHQTATIRYKLATEKEGNLIVIAILHFDDNNLISEINEVHNRLEE